MFAAVAAPAAPAVPAVALVAAVIVVAVVAVAVAAVVVTVAPEYFPSQLLALLALVAWLEALASSMRHCNPLIGPS